MFNSLLSPEHKTADMCAQVTNTAAVGGDISESERYVEHVDSQVQASCEAHCLASPIPPGCCDGQFL